MGTTPAAPIAERFGLLFDALDSDRDGAVTWQDYERLVDRYVTGYSLAPRDRRAQAVQASYQMLWLELLRHSQAPDERLGKDLFVVAMHRAAEDRSRFNMTEGVAEAAFDLLDTDRDDAISGAEFLRYVKVLGSSAPVALARFTGLDADGDGFISRGEFVLASREYLFGDEPDSPGGFVFGVV